MIGLGGIFLARGLHPASSLWLNTSVIQPSSYHDTLPLYTGTSSYTHRDQPRNVEYNTFTRSKN